MTFDPAFTRVQMTCSACPSQWDAWDADGTYYYVRYRWGRLTVKREGPRGELLVDRQLGDALDGVLATDEMLQAVSA